MKTNHHRLKIALVADVAGTVPLGAPEFCVVPKVRKGLFNGLLLTRGCEMVRKKGRIEKTEEAR